MNERLISEWSLVVEIICQYIFKHLIYVNDIMSKWWSVLYNPVLYYPRKKIDLNLVKTEEKYEVDASFVRMTITT